MKLTRTTGAGNLKVRMRICATPSIGFGTLRALTWKCALSGMLLGGCVGAFAQGQIANGTISASGTGPYQYSLSFGNAANATSPIGSIWYAWVPGAFYLPSGPTSASSPAGWTANISGHSIQWVANSRANDIAPGHTLAGFGYTARFSPDQLAAAFNSGVSVAYSGGLFSDAGSTFTVQLITAPEPSPGVLLVSGLVVTFLLGRKQGWSPWRRRQ
jgi:hypothetical protein